MKYIDLCGEKVSEIGVGLANSERYTYDGLSEAYRNGINYIDTARSYYNGQSEIIVGSWLPYVRRDTLKIATKVNYDDPALLTEEGTIDLIKESCAKLNTSYIDFLLLHGLDSGGNGKESGDEIFKKKFQYFYHNKIYHHLNACKEMGLIKHIGFSYFGSGEAMMPALEFFDFVQVRHNILDDYYMHENNITTPYRAALDYKNGESSFGIISMEVLRKGLFNHCQGFEDNGARVALEYVLRNHGSTMALLGFSETYQLRESIMTYKNIEYGGYYHLLKLFDECKDILNYLCDCGLSDCKHCYRCAYDFSMWRLRDLYDQYIASGHESFKIFDEFRKDNYIFDHEELINDKMKHADECQSSISIKDFIKMLKKI